MTFREFLEAAIAIRWDADGVHLANRNGDEIGTIDITQIDDMASKDGEYYIKFQGKKAKVAPELVSSLIGSVRNNSRLGFGSDTYKHHMLQSPAYATGVLNPGV